MSEVESVISSYIKLGLGGKVEILLWATRMSQTQSRVKVLCLLREVMKPASNIAQITQIQEEEIHGKAVKNKLQLKLS